VWAAELSVILAAAWCGDTCDAGPGPEPEMRICPNCGSVAAAAGLGGVPNSRTELGAARNLGCSVDEVRAIEKGKLIL
jgi:hypothetical protein